MTPPPENCRGAHIGAVSMARGDFEALCRRHPELRAGHADFPPESGVGHGTAVSDA